MMVDTQLHRAQLPNGSGICAGSSSCPRLRRRPLAGSVRPDTPMRSRPFWR